MLIAEAGRKIGLAVLLGAVAVPRVAFPQGSSELSLGQRVRITPPAKIQIPDVISVEGGRIASEGHLRREDGGKLLAVDLEGKTLHVPAPGATVEGKVVAVDEEAITILRDESPHELRVPRGAVARLEVGRGGKHRGLAVAGGAVVGMALAGGVTWHACNSWGAPAAAALMGIAGGIAGGVIGSASAGPHWKTVSPRGWHLAIVPGRRGALAMVTVAWKPSGRDVQPGRTP